MMKSQKTRLEELSHDLSKIKNTYASYINQQDTIVAHVHTNLRNDNNCDDVNIHAHIIIFLSLINIQFMYPTKN